MSFLFVLFPWLENTKGAHPFPFTPKINRKKKKKKKQKSLFSFVFPETTDSRMDMISFRLLIYKKGRLFFNRNKILYVTSIFFTLFMSPTFFLSFLPESKRTLVRNCADFHWTHQTHCNKHWSLEKTHSRFVLLHSEATLSLRKVPCHLISN